MWYVVSNHLEEELRRHLDGPWMRLASSPRQSRAVVLAASIVILVPSLFVYSITLGYLCSTSAFGETSTGRPGTTNDDHQLPTTKPADPPASLG